MRIAVEFHGTGRHPHGCYWVYLDKTERFNPSIPLNRKIPSKNSQVVGSRATNVEDAAVEMKVLMKNLVKKC